MNNKMHNVFSLCSFYNKKKKGDSWTGSEIREMGEVLDNPICRDELVWDGILRDYTRHVVLPAFAILLVAITAVLFLCYIGG